jgi:hypothetical protein
LFSPPGNTIKDNLIPQLQNHHYKDYYIVFERRSTMKNINKFHLLISILFLLSTSALGQFKGKMTFITMDKTRLFDVYSSDQGYRYEFDEDGQKGIVLVKRGTQDVIILMPQQKMAMISTSDNPMSMSNDPLKTLEYYKESGILKEVGEETIAGIPCNKSILYNKENPSQEMFTIWYSEQYKFPMKIINHIDGVENSGMEMKDIKPWETDPNKFEIPSDYQVMDVPSTMPNK